jgi:transcriptional regulator with XRE-family HTH domain
VKKIKRPTARTTLAYNLRLLRTQRNISQEELAGLAGLHRTFVGSVERGERNVSIDNIEKLAKALKVSVVDLLMIRDN